MEYTYGHKCRTSAWVLLTELDWKNVYGSAHAGFRGLGVAEEDPRYISLRDAMVQRRRGANFFKERAEDVNVESQAKKRNKYPQKYTQMESLMYDSTSSFDV